MLLIIVLHWLTNVEELKKKSPSLSFFVTLCCTLLAWWDWPPFFICLINLFQMPPTAIWNIVGEEECTLFYYWDYVKLVSIKFVSEMFNFF